MSSTRYARVIDGDTLPISGTVDFVMPVPEAETLVIVATLSDATAEDIDTIVVNPFDTNNNVLPVVIPSEVAAQDYDGVDTCTFFCRYDVRGITKLQVTISNATASARTLYVDAGVYIL